MAHSKTEHCSKQPTERELCILQAVVIHDCIKQASRTLGLSPFTVRNHLANLRRKSGLVTVTQLWFWAENVGMRFLPKGSCELITDPDVDDGPISSGAQWSGVSDAQWARIVSVIPVGSETARRERHRICYRSIVNGILFKMRTGCSWDAVPREFCTRSTGSRVYNRWLLDGTWRLIWRELYTSLSVDEKREWLASMLENGATPALLSR